MKAHDIDRLAKLSELRSAGALTDAEFEIEKQRLLSEQTSRRSIMVGAALLIAGTALALLLWFWTGRSDPGTPETTGNVSERQPSPIPSPSPLVASLTPTERLSQAFETATGHRTTFTQTTNDDVFTVSPVRMVDLSFGPALLVKREIKDGCHACTGYLGIYYFGQDQGQDVVTASFPEAVSGWGWGAAPTDWQITDRFTAYPAIYASGGYTGQGITMSSAAITELRPDGPVTSDLIGTGYSDGGAITEDDPRPTCDVEGKITNIVRDRHFDLVVTGSVSGRDRYVKRGGKFVSTTKRDWGSPCPTEQ